MKQNSVFLLALGLAIAFTSCNNKNEEETKIETDSTKVNNDSVIIESDSLYTSNTGHASAIINATTIDTVVNGTANFDTTAGGKVKMVVEVSVPLLKGKSLALHIHDHGDCGDKAEMAHGHWNPTNEEHGRWGSSHFHSGDIGNIKLDASGKGTLTIETDRWTLGGNNKTNILIRALILHSGSDDFETQPSGNSGSRIGCGVIK